MLKTTNIILSIAFFILSGFYNIYPSEYLFQSSFEDGISCLAEIYSPGAEKIAVIPDDNPDQWPDTGFGVIGYDISELGEHFHYKKRESNVFYLKEPLKKSHAFGTDVRTSNFFSWDNKINVTIDTGHAAMAECFGVNVLSNQAKLMEFQKVLSFQNSFYINYSVIISKKLMENIAPGRGFGFFVCRPFELWHTIQKDKLGGKCNFYSYFFNAQNNEEKAEILASEPVIPDKVYCLESHVQFIGQDKILHQFYVNGNSAAQVCFIHPVDEYVSVKKMALHFGNPNRSEYEGPLYFDEIAVSKKYIGVRPNQPVPEFNKCGKIELICSDFQSPDFNDRHKFSHWQIAGNGNFRLPLYNSGITMESINNLQVPSCLRITDELYWRVRHKGSSDLWSEWSRPMRFTFSRTESISPRWEIKDIEIYNPENKEKVTQLEKNKWYDFRLILGNGKIRENISYADLWLENSEDLEIAPSNRRLIKFDPEKNYWVSLSVGTPGLWVKNLEGASSTAHVTGTNGLFWQDSLRHFRINKNHGYINTRLRVLGKASSGLWTVSGSAKFKDGYETPTLTKPLTIILPLTDLNLKFNKQSRWRSFLKLPLLAFSMLFSFIFLLLILKFKKNYMKKLKNNVLIEVPTRQQEIINNAVVFIQEHYKDFDLSRPKIAQNLNISQDYLGDLFKKVKRQNISNFINDFRMEKAIKLIAETNLKVLDIAMEVGYKNTKHFIRAFKKKQGITPGQFREKHQISKDSP
ncbi:MAG: AraC family transcriptional regulator [bacterium]